MIVAFALTPLGVGEDVSEPVAEAVRVVRRSGLPTHTDAMFTSIEGEWDEVMGVVKQAVEAVAAIAPRVSMVLRAQRRRKHRPPLDRSTLHLLRRQNGRCPLCGDLLLHADREPQSPQEWEQWHRTTRKAITRHIVTRGRDGPPDGTRLIHAHCQRRATGARREPAPLYT
jgi:uncharacterized protein (TIGR00106 family)